MSRYDEFKKEMLADPVVKAEYDALESEVDIMKAIVVARKELSDEYEEH